MTRRCAGSLWVVEWGGTYDRISPARPRLASRPDLGWWSPTPPNPSPRVRGSRVSCAREPREHLLVQLKQERGTTLIVVTHNIPSARRIADTMLFLHEGRVLARGTAADLERSEHELVRKFMQSEAGG